MHLRFHAQYALRRPAFLFPKKRYGKQGTTTEGLRVQGTSLDAMRVMLSAGTGNFIGFLPKGRLLPTAVARTRRGLSTAPRA